MVNAQVFQKIQQEWGSFDRYLWHWTDENIIREADKVSPPLSDAISKDLKKRGMKFVGTIIIYAYSFSHKENFFCGKSGFFISWERINFQY